MFQPWLLLLGCHSFSLHLPLPPATAVQGQNPIRTHDRKYGSHIAQIIALSLGTNSGEESYNI